MFAPTASGPIFETNRSMSRIYYLSPAYLVFVILFINAVQASCPPSPVVLHSTLASECSQEPARSTIACSMYRLCKNENLDPPIFPVICNTWRVASSLCSDDPNYIGSIALCNQLQASYQDTTQFRSCMMPYPGLRNTSEIRYLHVQACGSMANPAEMLGCLSCTAESCSDPLLSYSHGCYDMDMGHCNPWINFCLSADASPSGYGAVELCVNPKYRSQVVMAPSRPPSPPPDPPTPALTRPPPPWSPSATKPPPPSGSKPGTSVAGNSPPASPLLPWAPPPGMGNRSQPLSVMPSCVTNPSVHECASYEYPSTSITADLISLCTSMPYMPGCTVRTACQVGQVSGAFCRPMTLLATVCADMPSMAGCKSYVMMCTNTSAVQQCQKFPAIPGLPSTSAARRAVIDMCGSMEMVQCDTCNKLSCPDYIGAMSSMCTEMPYMVGCDVYAAWCEASAAWEQPASGDGSSVRHYCGGAEVYEGASSSSDIPSMLMFFHQRTREILLFRTWLPKTTGEAVGSFIAITAMSLVSVLLRNAQHILVTAAATGRLGPLLAPNLEPPVLWWLPSRGQLLLNLLSSIITLVVSTLDLFTMLIAMTFNGAYFAAVVLGYGLGTLLLGHLRENYQRHTYGAASPSPTGIAGGDMESCCGGSAVPPATIIGLGSSAINGGGNAMAVTAANGGIGSFRVSSRQVELTDGRRS
ncbi:hypothetical protein Vafri_9580 [Volvox africanus]|uniref:Copper transporter n=1 Tax=Volvox africanus TaxID=51714 RepID=A0A8J4B4N5_9CHLO|nr:hypothetical protein Vafri_9580 [Volvox africanus]